MNPPKNFVPEPFQYHQEIDLEIETLTNRGIGLGRVDNWVVMVPFSLPGEKVRARVFRNHKNYSDADLVEVLKASPDRVDPQCPLFGICGGCQYQNLAYDKQLLWKQNQVSELFQQIAEITVEVNTPHASPKTYNYRSKITPHFPKPKDDKELPIGFLKYGMRQSVVDVPHCPIATDAINEALPAAREAVRNPEKRQKRGGTLLLRHTLEGVVTDQNKVVSERVGDVVFQFKAGDFFQNNPFILPHMIEYVLKQAKLEGIDYLVDAYCGVGVFALSASKHFEKCLGVEVNADAVSWANGNAAINRIENCEFTIGEAETIFSEIQFASEKTAMVIDPPRKGCDDVFIRQLLEYGPKRVVYVSCDPATQARDVKKLVEGGYVIKEVQPFDLFPQTKHIENVVTMDRS